MPSISIKGKDYEYSDSTVIDLVEGMIGLPDMKRAVLVEDPDFNPFYWLASLDDDASRFIVVETKLLFPDFSPESHMSNGNDVLDPDILYFAVVNVSSDWTKTTVNLKAPILLNPHTRRAAQVIFPDPELQLAQALTL
ncbi:MAG: flagellar assembly protein FliW [Pyrinomonadaceae bacterium]|nr:flagellar assembly protein FliW [Pyrinomonadaceae bacterium]